MSADRSDAERTEASAELLTRSRIEIANVLDELRRQDLPVSANLSRAESEVYITRIRQVDVDAGRYLVDYSQSKSANSRLLAAQKVAMYADVGHSHVAWVATSPVNVVYEGQNAIRLNFPELLIRHGRRSHPRFRIPPQLKLTCVVECPGFLPFEMEIADISLEGQGMLLSDPAIQLEPDTVLRGCRIIYPGRAPVVVDLEVRYAHKMALADAGGRRRVGCRFIGNVDDVADLVKLFSVKLDIVE